MAAELLRYGSEGRSPTLRRVDAATDKAAAPRAHQIERRQRETTVKAAEGDAAALRLFAQVST